jgi:tetratricopeptide (TPR) repeat protein
MLSIQQAIDAQDWDGAIGRLQDYVGTHPKDADAYNWLGFASRKKGNLDDAFRYYDTALSLNPKHRGAHEYLGEAYLQAGNLPKAQEHLAMLDKLCWLPCKEYSQLKAAIADYTTRVAQ